VDDRLAASGGGTLVNVVVGGVSRDVVCNEISRADHDPRPQEIGFPARGALITNQSVAMPSGWHSPSQPWSRLVDGLLPSRGMGACQRDTVLKFAESFVLLHHGPLLT
jgi:hypothetical protein